MPNYRRWYGEGGTFAFTVCLADRRRTTLTDEIDTVRVAHRATRAVRPFRTLALCVLSDHLHAVWTLPACPGPDPGGTRTTQAAGKGSNGA